MHVGIASPRRRGKRSRHSRRMRNPQFYVSGKRPIPTGQVSAHVYLHVSMTNHVILNTFYFHSCCIFLSQLKYQYLYNLWKMILFSKINTPFCWKFPWCVTLSMLLVLGEGNPKSTGGFFRQWPIMHSYKVIFLNLNRLLNKQITGHRKRIMICTRSSTES